MKTMKKLLAAMLAIAMLLTCAAFNPLTATAEGAATDSSETTRYCGNDDYPAKSLGGNYSGMPLNIDKKSDDSTKAASRGGQTILAYARNKYTSDGSYLPYAAWVTFNTEDPAGSFTELSRGGVEFYEAAYDGELLLHGNGIDDFLTATGLVSFDAEGEKSYEPHVPKSVIETEMQRRAFIRGLFLACGSVSEPKKAYHCELVFKNAELAMFSKRMISDFGIRIKCTERKGSIVLYIKESETLSDFLALAGASDAVMVLNEQRIVRQLNNTVNRGVNCINANIEKATRTAMKQAEDIRLVLSVVGAENLPPPLRIVAEARLNNFEMPLSELAEEIGIGRSAANYRLRKLCEMAEDIRTEMPD